MALKYLVFAILVLFAWSDFTSARVSEVLKVQLPHGGVLVGRHWTSHKGRNVRAFMGVPYALPPVGNLRFKPPVPYGSWSGERLAIKDAPPCIQRDPLTRQTEIVGSEDCLYLNVYTPEKPRSSKPLPVMVNIHGGGFISGTGMCKLYAPDYLLDHDIILVSGNYRLGPLGFLSTETLDCPGNFGLKDQTEILHWIHNNIAAFGGDPNSVTIFGVSAGGASVTYHLLTKQSEGLFHKAIAQSGTYYNPWAQPEHKGVPAKRARKVAQLVGCNPQEKWQAILRCLRNKEASDIVATLYEFFEWDFDPVVPFQPVVEPPHEGAFLTVLPRDVAVPYGFSLPLMIGVTSEEGLMKTSPLLTIPGLLTDYKNQIQKILPIELQYDHHAPEVQEEITRQIEQFYYKEGHNYDKNNYQNLTALLSDAWFVAGVDEYIKQRVDAQSSKQLPPSYAYIFEQRSPSSLSELFGESDEFFGVSHAEELQYLFPFGFNLFVSSSPTENDIKLREALLQMWVNFAREGNPTPANSNLTPWKPITGYPVNYARLGHKIPEEFTVLQMQHNMYGDRMNFWRQLKAHIPAEQRKRQLRDELYNKSYINCSTMALKDLLFATILFLLAWSDFTTARISEELKVQLPHGGVLVGRHWTSHKGRHIRAFMGVPFALPPVGNLRFKPPVPYGSWSGERLAIRDSAPCIHRDPFTRQTEIVGSEDCLYLNVYTPEKPRTSKPLPVMVNIHGGGFISGSGICSYYGPDYLLDHDIILVSGNYRLGPLGFLSTETLDCPGNFGLKDQTEVLRWVHNNIAAFGGDPNSVTIFGNSAGGASVTYQLVTSLSEGLFHKAIVQSGAYYNPWAQPEHKGVPAKRARKVAQLVGCNPEENWQAILRCLRNKEASDIVATLYEFFEWDFDPMVPFQPVVEPPHEGAFLTVLPRDGGMPHGFSLPLMIGVTSEEGLLKSVPLLTIPGLLADYKNQIKQILPIQLQYDHHTPEVRDEITREIEQFYFKEGHNYDKYHHHNLTDLLSDAWFIAGIDEYIKQRVEAQNSNQLPPFYVYIFEHRSPSSFSELFGDSDDYFGVCHAEELQYLFPLGLNLFVTSSPTENDIELREALLQMWVNFAKKGNPTPSDSNLTPWEPVTGYPVNYARLGHKTPEEFTVLQMESNIYADRANFWRQLKAHIPAEQRAKKLRDEL
ncbi:uncharacterized protein LOC105213718 [Zeugodacus cucurbitae]|uniref:uncharacterized protein LOC105213718 n=1 Tax=Zeugodacus cucurbitae TaxID=28588 RepID=UPI0010A73F2B|nr:uncharacterized protein LOC105213718 [Zeugodacus cucurbitae]